ncbi:acetamidase/formamidase family protein [Bradyrhizobium sp. 200]|uniref:acetamidase/formamidase family protein n=1 Tax=Bradyrhizobium sp. 200 TaxID=2782665 RepID=UPI001FFE9488|nr:acetamidase/formamidase family protein [Bradyrhizobium sp. 200]UPJ52726.1 acetamidase/formamidase family protein [Bradyrhizobium sp. 200]
MMDHHLASTLGNVQWGLWDGRLKPVLRIASGDRVTIETLSGEPDDIPDPSLGFSVVPGHREVLKSTFRGPGPHLLTGPIHIEGAEPGDVLEVRVLDIQLRADWGWNLQVPMLGTLPEDFPEFRRIHIPLDCARNVARLPWGQELPLSPFFGNFGVAPPASWGRLSSKEPRAFGGNMDNKELGVGSTVYFPIFVTGALFSAGDGHALQGDGEVCLTAIEAALTGTFEFHIRRDLQLKSPRAETSADWITMGFDEDLDDAAKAALRDMIVLIRDHTGLSAQDAYTLCSIAADLRVTQMVDGNKGIHCVIPKSRLPASSRAVSR